MQAKYCQSCRMPLVLVHDFGTNKNGTKNDDYCASCYKGGAFTKLCTMDEMIDAHLVHAKPYARDKTDKQLRMELKNHFAGLKRWKNTD